MDQANQRKENQFKENQDYVFNNFTERKNYNPMKHCEQHNQIKNGGEI